MQITTDSPINQKAFEQYLSKGTPIEVSLKMFEPTDQRPTRRYMWLTSGDDRVRPSHAANDGQICSWDKPLPTGHPGEEPGCRCVAVPYIDMQYATVFGIVTLFTITALSRPRILASQVLRAAIRRIFRREEPEAPKPTRSVEESPLDILKPNGQSIGKQGMRPKVRIVKGGSKEAEKLFERITKSGVPEKRAGYPGIGKRLPNGDWIGYRAASKSGSPTIDIDVKGVNFDKIHFYE